MTESEAGAPAIEPDERDAEDDAEVARTALEDLPDGSGCAEIWDYLSDRRREE